MTATLLQANFYQALKVPKPVFEKSMNTYLMDPTKRTQYEDEMQKLKEEIITHESKELTRDEVLLSVKKIEKAKLEAQKKMYEIVRS